jgi:hypothetical protein
LGLIDPAKAEKAVAWSHQNAGVGVLSIDIVTHLQNSAPVNHVLVVVLDAFEADIGNCA